MKRFGILVAACAALACEAVPTEPPATTVVSTPLVTTPAPITTSQATPGYFAHDLGVLTGEEDSWALGINNRRVIVGRSGDLPFRWTIQGGMEALGTFDAAGGEARAINNAGEIVGWTWVPDETFPSVIRQGATRWNRNGQAHLLEQVWPRHSVARAINEKGDVAGNVPGDWGLIWPTRGGVIEVCREFGDVDLHGINDRGQVVGRRWGPTHGTWYTYSGIVWSVERPSCAPLVTGGVVAGSVHEINNRADLLVFGIEGEYDPTVPDGIRTTGPIGGFVLRRGAVATRLPFGASAMNKRGDIVGNLNGEAYFLSHRGKLIHLGAGQASAINDRGDVAGRNGGRAVIWTPQPLRKR